MPNYRRWLVPGGTYFFTVNLLRRDSRLLVEYIDALRAAYADASRRLPFETVAICILPNHLHCICNYGANYGERCDNPQTAATSLRRIEFRHRPIPAHRHLVRPAAFDQAGGGEHRHLAVDRLVVAPQFARQPPLSA